MNEMVMMQIAVALCAFIGLLTVAALYIHHEPLQ